MDERFYEADLKQMVGNINPDTIISRKLLKNEYMQATLFGFAPGQELTEHTASRPAILHFLTGQGAVTLGETKYPAGADTWVYMPAHLPHSIEAETEMQMLLILLGE